MSEVSSRVAIARAWAYVAANDLTSATSAATTALQDIVSSSKLSSQTNIYDVEALLLVANLIGLGLDDLPNQAQILALCVKDYPTSPPRHPGLFEPHHQAEFFQIHVQIVV